MRMRVHDVTNITDFQAVLCEVILDRHLWRHFVWQTEFGVLLNAARTSIDEHRMVAARDQESEYRYRHLLAGFPEQDEATRIEGHVAEIDRVNLQGHGCSPLGLRDVLNQPVQYDRGSAVQQIKKTNQFKIISLSTNAEELEKA